MMNTSVVHEVATLVALLNNPTTAQQDKAQIFQRVETFRASAQAWQVACEFLRNLPPSSPDTDTVALFFLNCLEAYCSSLIRFESIPSPTGRVFVRETLLLLVKQPNTSQLLKRKSSLILVMMGQREFNSTWLQFAQECCENDDLLVATCENIHDFTKIALTQFRASELQRYCNSVAGPLFIRSLTQKMQQQQQQLTPQVSQSVFALTEWVPLEHITFDFIQAISVSSSNNTLHTLANILDRNYFPTQQPQAGMFLELISTRAMSILEQQQTDPEATLAFLFPFTKRHFAKLQQQHTNFPVQRFLELMFAFTFQLRSIEPFYSALEVWELFIETCQEHELNAQTASPLAAPVIAPLLVRLLEMFLYAKTTAPVTFLQSLADSFTLNEEDPAPVGEPQHSDLDVIIARIMGLVQRTSFLPFSSAQGLSTLLQNSYLGLAESASKLLNSELACAAAHDAQVHLQIVSQCSALFTKPAFAALPQVTELATWSVQIVRLCLEQQLWQRGAHFVRLHSQALFCLQSFTPWAKQTGNEQFSLEITVVAVETLQKELLPEEPKLKAVLILRHAPAAQWTQQISSLFDFTAQYSDLVRQRVYSTFALCTVDANEQALQQAVQKDLLVLLQGKDHEKKRSLKALQSVLEITINRPETAVKVQIFELVCKPAMPALMQLLASAPSPSLVSLSLDFLLVCFKHLGKQLKTEGCMQIVQQALQASGHSPAKVFQLLVCVAEEPTNAFNSLLAPILTLCQQQQQNSPSAELDEVVCRVLYLLMMKHWRWVVSSPSPDTLDLVCTLLLNKIHMDTPPDLVRNVCKNLCDVSTTHGLFAHVHFTQRGYAFKLFSQCMQLIASREREIIADELMQTLFALAKADTAFFVQQIWQQPQQQDVVERMLKDQGVFEEAVLAMCASRA